MIAAPGRMAAEPLAGNAHAADAAWGGGVHRAFEAAARARPQAPAAVFAHVVLSYGELNAQANRLARALIRQGVGADSRVAVVMERGPELAVALLAAFKAGAAYVPVDPDHPEERIRFLLADSGARMVLTDARTAHRVPAFIPIPVLALELAPDAPAAHDAADLPGGAHADALAYVIYTSGSTGRPKGVGITHGALEVHTRAVTDLYGLRAGDRVAQIASLGFDISVEEMFPTWAVGGAVVFRPTHLAAYGQAFGRWLAGNAVSVLNVPTAFWHAWTGDLASAGGVLPPSLRLVVVGGERALPHVWEQWARLAGPGVTWINAYGPTETTVGVTAHTRPGGGSGWGRGDISIGLPLHEVRAYVLDGALTPVEPGAEGELVVGGPRVARGYLGLPAMTAGRFVPDPFAGQPGARMYRTGDRVRWPAGGEMEFLGRMDGQVKVGGFRVEPAETEAVLAAHPQVAGAAVVAREDEPGRRRLVGYWVPAPDGAASSEAELRAFLGRRLPPYMVPSTLVRLDALPLSANGKVDRRALPVPGGVAGDADWMAPRTPTQQVLAEVWADVLGAARVGEYDDFFALGGHSLLAMQVMARIRQLLGVELPVRALFETPALAAFAEVVEEWMGVDAGPGQPPLEPAPREGPLPLSFAQQRLWFLQQLEPDSPFYNIPAAVRLAGPLDGEALRGALGEVVRRHESLRTALVAGGGQPVQVVMPAEPFDLPLRDLSHLAPPEREGAVHDAARAEAERPFRLERGPMLRAALLRLAPGEHVLLLNLHHAAGDGWSLGVLFHELGTLYGALARGRAPALPPLPVQYADYALWQRRWLTDEVLERQLAYWRGRLGSAPPLLELPTDRPRPAVQSHRGGLASFRVGRELTDRLHGFARANGATLYMTLLAGLNVALHRWSGQDDLVVGSPTAGRVRRELEGLIGFFVNTLALRVDLSGDPSFAELVRRVRETTLDAYAHQDLPFERIVEELQPERSLGRSPLFQVSLVLQNAPMRPLEMAGLTLRLEPLGSGTSKFDLSLELTEDADGLAGEAEYAADLWNEPSIDRMLRQLLRVLDAATADPSLPLSRVPLLAPGEPPALLAGPPAPPCAPVHEQVARVAARVPVAPAVVFGGRVTTYAELHARAEHLARHLVALGVGPDAPVGVFAERGTDMVVALLAVLRAGGAYVPLQPGLPPRRIGQMARGAGLRLVLVPHAAAAGALPADAGARVAVMEALEALEALEAQPLPNVHPEQAAYVIHTSGSTGEPKGVVVSHGALANHMAWMQRRFPLHAGDRVLQKTPFGFDAAVWEFWAPLLAGATLVVAPPGAHRDPRALAEEMARERITVAQFVPALLELVLREPALHRCRALRRVFCGGEALPPRVARACRDTLAAELCNLYGPTETCIDATWHLAGGDDEGSVPIGVPVDGVTACVLDAAGHPVPAGVRGELFLGGAQVARGYVGRPGLTAERFVPDPFAGRPGARMYRTGDLARWRADGALAFLGRADEQVKIRGHRIEPGEVESVLRRHPLVAEAAVLARPDADGAPRLVGWVVPARVEPDAPAQEEVGQWEAVFEGMYGREEAWAAHDATLNLTGWTNSYTGLPIAAEEMREWVDGTAERILALAPDRVLELGVGSGLFLFRVAPHASLYVGADLSAHAIRALSDALPRAGVRLPPVRLLARPADDFSGLEPRSFDTVILNSVVQYFPSAGYLERVVAGAVERVRDGGAVFLGDLRALGTLGALHAAVELAHAPDGLSAHDLRARAARRGDDEEELVLDPRFFAALRARVPRVGAVEVLLKRGVHHNELTRHRYDVVLHVGADAPIPPPAAELAWGCDVRSLAELRSRLAGGAARVSGIPDARVAPEVRLAGRLALADSDTLAGELRPDRAGDEVDPESVWALADALGMRAVLRPSPGVPGAFDAALLPGDHAGPAFAEPDAAGPPGAWASDPGRAARLRGLVPRLREHLLAQLPEYMVPAALVTLDALPRTPSGKLDRRALPDPEPTRAAGGPPYVAPRTAHEEALCALWSELLRMHRVGVDDDFFRLGGHSLLATVLVSRIRDQFGVNMPLHRVFQTPTVAGLAAAVHEANEQVLAALLSELDELSDDEARALLALEAEGLTGLTAHE